MTLTEQRAILLSMEHADVRSYSIRPRRPLVRLTVGLLLLMAACMIPLWM